MVRKSIIFVALCAAIGLSATAYAGNNNNAAVNQSGISNTATVDQTAANFSNQALSNIYFNPGDGNTIDQQGSYNSATVTQAGNNNDGQVQQVNNNQYGSATLGQNGTGLQGYIGQGNSYAAIASIEQEGTNNYANLLQTNSNSVNGLIYQAYFFGPGVGDSAYLWMNGKTGESSNAWTSQNNTLFDGGGITFIVQGNDTNDFAWIDQYASDINTSAGIFQSNGASNSATIWQAGENQGFATVEQHGTGDYALAQQYSGTSEAHIVQYGTGNQAQTYQLDGAPGAVNSAEIDQGLTDNTSSNNIASINQSGFSNTALITQNGNSNNASIAQAGTGNNATIHQ